MNVRIFWVRAMKCMYAQTRPRFILSSEGVLGGMEFEPMLTPREKSPLPKMSPEEDWTRDTVDSEPKHYQLSYSGPPPPLLYDMWCGAGIAQSVVCWARCPAWCALRVWFSSELPVGGIFPLELTWVLTPFPKNFFGWEYKLKSSLCTQAFHHTDSKGPDIHVQDRWILDG